MGVDVIFCFEYLVYVSRVLGSLGDRYVFRVGRNRRSKVSFVDYLF